MKLDMPLAPTLCDTVDQQKVEKSQEKMKNRPGKPHTLNVGDCVLAKQKKKNKLTPAYNPEAAIVTDVKGSMVTVTTGKKYVTRDGSAFKKLAIPISDESSGDEAEYAAENENRRGDEGVPQAQNREDDSAGDDTDTDAPEVQQPQAPARTRPVRSTAGKRPARFADYEM